MVIYIAYGMSGVAILYVEICVVYRNMYGLIYIFMD